MNRKISRAPATGSREQIPISAYSREVRGYHGCERRIAERLLRGDAFAPSTNAWDWLGDGIYFWEYGPDRALRWAEASKRIEKPSMIGAMIQLGRCFDLLDTRFTRELREFYDRWIEIRRSAGMEVPVNRGKGRFLDRAVIEAFFQHSQEMGTMYDSVRAAFVEGDPIYPGSGLFMETHIQIAVRNPESIVGVFRPVTYLRHEGNRP